METTHYCSSENAYAYDDYDLQKKITILFELQNCRCLKYAKMRISLFGIIN